MRVNQVKCSRKAQGKCGQCGCEIKQGDPYIWWKFRYGGKRIRCAKFHCYPKPSELVNSDYLSSAMAIEEAFQADVGAASTVEDVRSAAESAAGSIRDHGEEQRSKYDNMPDGLQQGPIGEMLEQRADACEAIADSLDELVSNLEEDDRRDLDEGVEDDVSLAVEDQSIEREEDNETEDFETDEEWAVRCKEAVQAVNDSRLESAKEEAGEASWEFE